MVRESRLSLSAADFALRLELGAVFPTRGGPFMDQAAIAEAFNVTDRQIRNLEAQGLPVDRASGKPQYPTAACMRWWQVYQHRVRNRCWGGFLTWLDAWREQARLSLREWPDDWDAVPRGLLQALQQVKVTTSRAELVRIRRLLAQAEALNTEEDA